MTAVFVDTSAFVALADKRDKNHGLARRLLRSLAKGRRPVLTSTYVADEVTTLVRMRLSHPAALRVGEAILTSKWCRMLEVDDGVRRNAWNLFTRYDDQMFSFTDCTSFALMTDLGLEEAFTFDRRDFAAAGFIALPLEASR